MYMNFSSTSGSYSDAALDVQHIGDSSNTNNTSQEEVLLNFGGSRSLEHDFSSWKDSRNEMQMMHTLGEASGVLHGDPTSQGLSLSLGTQVPSLMQMASPFQYQNANANFSSMLGHVVSTSGEDWSRNVTMEGEDNFQMKQSRDNGGYMSNLEAIKTDISSYGMPSIARAVPNSKYLKAAQHLLDEVVNVKKAIMDQKIKRDLKEVHGDLGDGASDPSGAGSPSVQPEASKSQNELSVAEKQDLQSKTTKLVTMLDEVDRRYRQYHHQMQIVVSSFDMIAGSGAAKPYTALALQTISRHFRCLRDAINGQIHVAQKNLGEEDSSSNDKGSVGISRLRYVDQQLKQQRALQQLGMMQQHAWRPQRGLPESSVSILRAWLFEHFLHPYPKDSDKIMLARQTGLTRSQVSNWFINARVRLWKPMVEEMYKEEALDSKMESNSSSETTPRNGKTIDTKVTEDLREDLQWGSNSFKSKSDQVPDVEMLVSDTNSSYAESNCGGDRFLYQMSELERFGNGNGGVSLTLGLQQCEGVSINMTNDFVPMRDNDVYNNATSSMGNEAGKFDYMGSVNEPQRLSSLQSFTRLL